MNLSPAWVESLRSAGHEAEHWSRIGDPCASDRIIFERAKSSGCVVFTHDLDFGSILAATDASGPSVIQLRTQDISPGACGDLVNRVIKNYRAFIEAGALISIDEHRARVRILPL